MRQLTAKPPTTQVFVTENNQQRLVTTREDLEQVCINENDSRFSQSSDTPFMQLSLCEDLGFLAENDIANQILQGTYSVPASLDIYTKKMIGELQTPPSICTQPTTCPTISTQEHIKSWRKQKERTASNSISGISFSHYIAVTHDPTIAEFDTIM